MAFEFLTMVIISLLLFCVTMTCGLQVDANIADEHAASIFRAESLFLQNVGNHLKDNVRHNPEDTSIHT